MPGTASTRRTDGDRLRSRPVTPRAARPGVFGAEMAGDLPPVLFRLPAIAPRSMGIEPHAPDQEQAVFSPGVQTVAMPVASEPATESAYLANCSRGEVHALQPTLETFGNPSPSEAEKPVATEASSVKPMAAATAGATASSAPQEGAAPMRTWWEHWSSGVVLILLIVALVTASIVALNDGGKSTSNYLAGQAESSMADEFDLSNITVPDITIPPNSSLNNPSLNNNELKADARSKDAASPLGLVVDSSLNPGEQTGANASVGPSPQVEIGSAVSVDSALATSPELADDGQTLATVSPPAVSPPAISASTPAAAAEVAPRAVLDRPVGVSAPQLFANSATQENAVQSNAAPTAPVVAASNPSVSLQLPSAPSSAGVGKLEMDGSSPTFYDGASHHAGQHPASINATGTAWPTETTSANMPSEGLAHSAEVAIDTELPSYPAILASATVQASGVGASAANQRSSQSDNPASGVSAVPSATPDLDGNSLVNEYFKFERMRQAAETSSENRYPGSAATSSQSGVPPQSASQPLGNGSGFTLGNPQAGTPAAPPLPR